MDEKERYEKAKKRVEDIKGFYMHLMMYIIVNIAVFIINITATPEHLWFYWSLLGWGIGIAAHGFSIFGLAGLFGPEWEERKIQKIMKEQEKKEL
jgi:hypothetical protein